MITTWAGGGPRCGPRRRKTRGKRAAHYHCSSSHSAPAASYLLIKCRECPLVVVRRWKVRARTSHLPWSLGMRAAERERPRNRARPAAATVLSSGSSGSALLSYTGSPVRASRCKELTSRPREWPSPSNYYCSYYCYSCYFPLCGAPKRQAFGDSISYWRLFYL